MTASFARRRAALAALACGLLLAGSLLAGLPAAGATTPKPLADLVRVEEGATDQLGGGDYLTVRVNDQVFGVVYGSASQPAPVTYFTLFTRVLGTATVRDADSGKLLAQGKPIPVRTLVAEKLDAGFEFRDMNGDGIFQFTPNPLTADPMDIIPLEPLVKAAPLEGDWNLSGFSLEAVSDNEVQIHFTLTLDGMGYHHVQPGTFSGDGEVNTIELTAHLVIARSTLSAPDVPLFNATVERSGAKPPQLVSITPAGSTSGNFTSTSARFKVDHDITGWDFMPPRDAVSSKLLLHATILVLNGIDRALANWLGEAVLDGLRAGEVAVPQPDSSELRISAERPAQDFTSVQSGGEREDGANLTLPSDPKMNEILFTLGSTGDVRGFVANASTRLAQAWASSTLQGLAASGSLLKAHASGHLRLPMLYMVLNVSVSEKGMSVANLTHVLAFGLRSDTLGRQDVLLIAAGLHEARILTADDVGAILTRLAIEGRLTPEDLRVILVVALARHQLTLDEVARLLTAKLAAGQMTPRDLLYVLAKSVETGELSEEQARALLGAVHAHGQALDITWELITSGREARRDALTVNDHWRRVAGLGWVPTVTVWPNSTSEEPVEGPARFQVLGGAPFQVGYNGTLFRGFVLSGGFVYPAGYRIHHDPTLEAQSTEVEQPSFIPSSVITALVLVGQVVLVAGLIVVGVILASLAASKAAQKRSQDEARRRRELMERYKLPPGGGGGGVR